MVKNTFGGNKSKGFARKHTGGKKDNILRRDQTKNSKNAFGKSDLTKDELKNIKTKIKSILKDL